jgi:predicted dehydrogenase
MVTDAAQRGLHVLVEKPMATTLADCDAMRDACHAAGVTLVVGHIQHFLPEKVAVQSLLADGGHGPVVMIHDYRTTDYRPTTRSAWFFSPQMAGGGALMNIGAHGLDRSTWLGGAPAEQITAATARRFGVAVETDGALRLRLANGVPVSISVVSDTPHKADDLTIVCERAVITASPRLGVHVQQDGRTRQIRKRRPSDIPDAFRAQLSDFAATVDGRPAKVSIEHARHVVELVLAAYRSAELRETVAVRPTATHAAA